MDREETISKYIIEMKLDVEKMIQDFRGYIHTIIENNVGDRLSNEDKEEIMSDVFLTVWHNKEKIDNSSPLKYYMAGIARNLISNKLRKQNKKYNQIEFDETEIIDMQDMDIICEQDEILEVISEELNNMKEKDYMVFAKYYYYSKTIKEIAIELGMSESNVGVRLHRIKKKLKKELENRGFRYKQLLTIIILIFVFTGVAIACNIVIKTIKKQIFPDTSQGVDTAIDNGYIQDVKSEYIQSNDIEIKVKRVLMDDYNLDIEFEIMLQNTEEKIKVNNFVLSNLLIVDENENVIVRQPDNTDDGYERVCKIGNVNPENDARSYSNGSEYFRVTENIDNYYGYAYTTQSNGFPKSKKLKVIFDKLILWDKNMDIIGQIEGEWVIEIDLPEEFYNRETITYKVKSCNRKDVDLVSLMVSKTGAKLNFIAIWGDPIFDEDDTMEEIAKKTEEWLDLKEQRWRDAHNIILPKLINDDYIINENGKKFYRSESSSDGNMQISQGIDGTMSYYQTYDLTSFEATDRLTIVLPLGAEMLENSDVEEIIIELERNK